MALLMNENTKPGDHRSKPQRVPQSLLLGFLSLVLRGLLDVFQSIAFVILLIAVDLSVFLLELINPKKTPNDAIPLPFSPESPPPFKKHPVVFCLCTLTRWLGGAAPEWMREWSRWEGVDSKGRWKRVDENLDLNDLSRSPCPALNAMANHGILRPSGKDLSFHHIAANVSRTYNLSPSLAVQLLSAAWPLFQSRGKIELGNLCTHGVIEHDASLLRPDTYMDLLEEQCRPHLKLIDRFFPRSKGILNTSYFSEILSQRRKSCMLENVDYHQEFKYKFFGSGNCAMLLEVFGGNVKDIRAWVGESGVEKMSSRDWKPQVNWSWGLPIVALIYSTLEIESRTTT